MEAFSPLQIPTLPFPFFSIKALSTLHSTPNSHNSRTQSWLWGSFCPSQPPLFFLGCFVLFESDNLGQKMPTCVSKSVPTQPQGIGSILGTEADRSKTVAPLRRTLSADMSSKKWLAQHGFSPLKKIASSEEFPIVSSPELQNNERFNTWSSTQSKEKKQEPDQPEKLDIFSSILSEKSSSVPPPYVHPLVKRQRSLSQKSLEICTESLGSETGSDGFSSYSPSESSDAEQEEQEQETEEEEVEVVVEEEEEEEEEKESQSVVNYNYSYETRKSPTHSFPPPIPSLSSPGLHMRSHRDNGRLVLEAVPVPAPSRNYFQAHRQGGRLVLTFINSPCEERIDIDDGDDDDDDDEEEIEEFEEMVKVEEEVRSIGIPPKKQPSGMINVHRSALMVNKFMGLTNMNPSWSPKYESNMEDEPNPIPQSFPTPPRLSIPIPKPTSSAKAVAASFNSYDYYWRGNKHTTTTTVQSLPPQPPLPPISKNYNNNKFFVSKKINQKQFQEQEQLRLRRGNKADYLVPSFRGCNEPRRTLLIWEPYCIATS